MHHQLHQAQAMTSYSLLSEVLAITSPFFLKKIIEKESRVKGKRELSFLFSKKNSQTRMHLRWNEHPPSSSLHFPFLKLSTRCIQDKVGEGGRNSEEGNGERKDGRKEGCKVLLVGVLVVPFEGDALQEARGRSGCKGIVTWPRGRYRFLVAARYKRET